MLQTFVAAFVLGMAVAATNSTSNGVTVSFDTAMF